MFPLVGVVGVVLSRPWGNDCADAGAESSTVCSTCSVRGLGFLTTVSIDFPTSLGTFLWW